MALTQTLFQRATAAPHASRMAGVDVFWSRLVCVKRPLYVKGPQSLMMMLEPTKATQKSQQVGAFIEALFT